MKPETTTWYHFDYAGRLQEIEVVRETPHQVVVLNPHTGITSRRMKGSYRGQELFRTKLEAYEDRLNDKRKRLNFTRREIKRLINETVPQMEATIEALSKSVTDLK